MAKTPIAASWTANSTSPYADQSYPNGDRALEGGNSALSWSATGLETGDTLTISTDGTFNFGAVGPELVCLYDTSNVDGSGNLVPILGPNTTVNSGVFQVESVAGMPNDAGYKMVIANKNSVSCVTHSRGFESRTYYWPESSRVPARAYLLDPATDGDNKDWQIKPVWNMSDFDFGGTDTDFFMVTNERFYATTKTWYKNAFLSSNSVPSVYCPNALLSFKGSSNPSQEPLAEPYTTEFFFDQVSTASESQAFFETLTSSPSIGAHYAKDRQTGVTLHESTGATKQINSFTYPGFLNGFGNYDESMTTYDGEFYKAAGAGAACRVVISDHADVEQASKKVILEVGSWGSSQITAKLRGGWWDMSELSGKHICVVGSDNNQIASIQLVGA